MLSNRSQEYAQILLSLLKCRVLHYDRDQLLKIIDSFYEKNKDYISYDTFIAAKNEILSNIQSYITDNEKLVHYIHTNYPNITIGDFKTIFCQLVNNAFNENLLQSIKDIGDKELFDKIYDDISLSIFYNLITATILSSALPALPDSQVPKNLSSSIFTFLVEDVDENIETYNYEDYKYHINSYIKTYGLQNFNYDTLDPIYDFTFNLIKKYKEEIIDSCYDSIFKKYKSSIIQSESNDILTNIKNKYETNPDLQIDDIKQEIQSYLDSNNITDPDQINNIIDNIVQSIKDDPDIDSNLSQLIIDSVDQYSSENQINNNKDLYNSIEGDVSTNITTVKTIPSNIDSSKPTYTIPITSDNDTIVDAPTTLTITGIDNNTVTVNVTPETTVSELVDQINNQLPDDSQLKLVDNFVVFPNNKSPNLPTIQSADETIPVKLNSPVYTDFTTDKPTSVDDIPSTVMNTTNIIFDDPNNINTSNDPGIINIIVNDEVISITVNPGDTIDIIIQQVQDQLPNNTELTPLDNGFSLTTTSPVDDDQEPVDVTTSDNITNVTPVPVPPQPVTVTNPSTSGSTIIDPTTPLTDEDGNPQDITNKITIVNVINGDTYTTNYTIVTPDVSNLKDLINKLQDEVDKLKVQVKFLLDNSGQLTVVTPNSSTTQVNIEPTNIPVEPISIDTNPINTTTNTTNTNPLITEPDLLDDSTINNPQVVATDPEVQKANNELLNNTSPDPDNNPVTTQTGLNNSNVSQGDNTPVENQPAITTDPETGKPTISQSNANDDDLENINTADISTTESGLPIIDTDDLPNGNNLDDQLPADIPDLPGNPSISPAPVTSKVPDTPVTPLIDIPDLPGDPSAIDQPVLKSSNINNENPTSSDVGSIDTTGVSKSVYPKSNSTVYNTNHSKSLIDKINDITQSIYSQNAAWANLLSGAKGNVCNRIANFLPGHLKCSSNGIIFTPFGDINLSYAPLGILLGFLMLMRKRLEGWFNKIKNLINKFLNPLSRISNMIGALLTAIAGLAGAIASPKAICAFLKNPGKLFNILFNKPGIYVSFEFNIDEIIQAIKNMIKYAASMIKNILKMLKDQILMMINTIKNAISAIYRSIAKAMGSDMCDLIVGLAMAVGLLPKVFRALKVLASGGR